MNFFGGGKSQTPSEDGPEFPAGDEGLNKPSSSPSDMPSLPEDIFGDVSLDVETPGSVEDWKSAALPPRSVVKNLLKNPGKYAESERGAQSLFLFFFVFFCFLFFFFLFFLSNNNQPQPSLPRPSFSMDLGSSTTNKEPT